MNKRIDELTRQATVRVNSPIVNSDGKVVCDNWKECVSLSIFHDLIIKECAKWIEDARDDAGDFIGDSFYWTHIMKKHFGVEE